METREIRDRFLAFFEREGHERVRSSSLIPDDPNLLLTNAGMNQFKPYFLGEQTPPYDRAMTVQKCFRTVDIDEVGDPSHLTFFEMLGNFSFGDYYKEKACPFAWKVVTEEWGIDPERLWITIYETDDEARDVWTDVVGVDPKRIVRLGKGPNFWHMGVAGPCGPCSEVFFDLGEAFGPPADDGPAGNEDRYLEIWNLVFMQSDCNDDIEPIADLPKKNIDTGAGLERVAMALQGKSTLYETDTLRALISTAEDLTKKTYEKDERTDVGLRILADHGRGMTFLLADGVLPSNEERGYVLRRIMRRAVRQARLLGRDEPVLPELARATRDLMGGAYPELVERFGLIEEIAAREEERFDATLKQGLALLESEIETAKAGGRPDLSGDVAFKLHDTFGFPIDITNDVAGEAGISVDTKAFDVLMQEQRTRARSARRKSVSGRAAGDGAQLLERFGPTEFIGYEHLRTTGKLLGAAGSDDEVLREGDEVDVLLDRTVFYAEGGGQVGDRGSFIGPSGRADVIDTQRLAPGLTAHRIKVSAGEMQVGEELTAEVDATYRRSCERAHTATHVLHWILRDRLGDHAKQAGSLVEPGRLRFDFNHFDALGQERLGDISSELQTRVLHDDDVRAYETSYDYARSTGAMAIFGEKYGDFVRVVEVGDYSKELCGGTHVPHTSQIGVIVVTGEGSVGANLRRIEALVGHEGVAYLQRRVGILEETAAMLRTNPDELAVRVEKLLETQKEMERKIGEIERHSAEGEATELAQAAEQIGDARLIVARRESGVDVLRSLAQTLKGRVAPVVVVLGTSGESNANLVCAVSKDLVGRGLSARELLAPGAALLGGGAGGKPELSISGGPNRDRLEEALSAVSAAAREALTR